MRINGFYSSAMQMDDPELYFQYTRYFRLVQYFNPGLHRSLMIGGAGYSYPKDYLARYRNAYLDVVEIDPMVTELARQYFDLKDDKRLKIIHEDGRTFINTAREKYDAIFNDSFSSPYAIPYHLTTVEAVRKMNGILNEDGVVLVNIISSLEGPSGAFLRAEYRTFKSIFPQVYLFPVESTWDGEAVQNVMLVALKSNRRPSLKSSDPELNGYLSHLWRKDIADDMPVLSDDYAPVDYYISKVLMKT
jgi:spermidine synthase